MELKCLKCGCEGAYKYGHMKGNRDTDARIAGINLPKQRPEASQRRTKFWR